MNKIRITHRWSLSDWKAELILEDGSAHVIPFKNLLLEVESDPRFNTFHITVPADELEVELDAEVVTFLKGRLIE